MDVSSNKIIVIMILLAVALSAMYYMQYIEIRADYDMEKYVVTDKDFSYDLFSPEIKYELDHELNEISGLSYLEDGQLACVQDEDGILYIYDLIKEDVLRRVEFESSGDFEGVEVVNGIAYVLKSDGDIYKFNLNAEELDVQKLDTDLKGKNDTEGLGYLKSQGTLLIACKESGDSKEVDVKGKAVYQYDLEEDDFIEQPIINFSDEYLEENVRKFGLKKKHLPFKPSAIATHPLTGNIYILSSTAKMLLVTNPSGIILSLTPLDAGIFRQPEGICFANNGEMYISSEGKGSDGYILYFPNLKAK